MPLLDASPLAKEDASDEITVDKAESFDASTHVRYFTEVFKLFSLDLSKWALCSTSDSSAINKRVAVLLNAPHIGCKSQKLN